MKLSELGQMILILTNISVIIGIVMLISELQHHTNPPQMTVINPEKPTELSEEAYVDVAALKCPSSYDDENQQFRSENYWLFQKKPSDHDITMILRPDRNTGTWNQDLNNTTGPMTVTPDTLIWTSALFSGNDYTLNRKDLSMERQRINRSTINSQCVTVQAADARDAVTKRYEARLEGNKI